MRMRCLFPAVVLLAASLAAAGCLAPPNVCRGDPGGPTPSADEVCDHLAALNCFAGPIPEFVDGGAEVGPVELRFDAAGAPLSVVHAGECRAGYASWEGLVGPGRFPALARCYTAARNCEEVEACNRGCPLDPIDVGAPMSDAPVLDASVLDAPAPVLDASVLDAPVPVLDAPTLDAHSADAGIDAP